VILIFSCKNAKVTKEDEIVVSVGEKHLFKSQLTSLLYEGTSKEDSTTIVNGFILNWIRESLMALEAEKIVGPDLNIDKLVADYRSSLLVDNYEKHIIETTLDTVINIDELKTYYEANKEHFELSQAILKCIMVKISNKIKGSDALLQSLERSDLTEATILIKEKASKYRMDTTTWLTVDDIRTFVPAAMASKYDFDTRKTFSFKDNENQYFVKILKYYDEGEIPPFNYIKVRLEKEILNERKISILKQVRQGLYDKAVQNKMVKYHKS
jgi:hypothetical protein